MIRSCSHFRQGRLRAMDYRGCRALLQAH